MILPTKHVSENDALLGVALTLLKSLTQPDTVSGLWESVRDEQSVGTFERFVLAADLLYIFGLIEFNDGLISRCER
ncbi:hypothetical protein L5876_11125 [Hyphobacterium sp. SN044]|uniref:ABC-three component system middle component 6 n=1 Tax=Hyphobacterium sp. SN044 TaxID=2912575 RepID=UPI001F34FF0F|nr:ABC-three component system middle component 6 [Hyphobacterium sp. SN044]MCF8880368.1 hypothetical protein [Hyphobacterium sp. SN044]